MKKAEFDQKLKEKGVSFRENFAFGSLEDAEGNFLRLTGIDLTAQCDEEGPYWIVEEYDPDHEGVVFTSEEDTYDYLYKRILDRLEKGQVFWPQLAQPTRRSIV